MTSNKWNIFQSGNVMVQSLFKLEKLAYNKKGLLIILLSLVILFESVLLIFMPTQLSVLQDKPNTDAGCDDATHTSKQQCWEEKILTTLEKQDTADAFKLLAYFYATEPAFAKDCHGYTHYIGEKAYQLFSEGKEFTLTQETSYCGYGFYHGFMETMLYTSGDFAEARAFCTYVGEKLKRDSSASWNACYHGFGHGVTDDSDPRTWGDARAMAGQGLSLCEQIGITEFEKNLCASGVFNALAIAYQNPLYKLYIVDGNPYWICEQQEKEYFKEPCYDQMNTLALSLSGSEFTEAIEFIKKIKNPQHAWHAMHGLSTAIASSDEEHDKIISVCQSLNQNLREVCLSAFIGGIIEHGPPDEEYILALDFCALPQLSAQDKLTCYQAIKGYSWQRYSKEKFQDICSILNDYRYDICP